MKRDKLEKIAKEIAHPFISILPNQEYFDKKLEWYTPVIGILESSAAEFLFPLVYVSINPGLAELAIGGAIMIDGLWRAATLTEEKFFIGFKGDPPSPKIYSGTNFLEIPYNIYKKIEKKEFKKVAD